MTQINILKSFGLVVLLWNSHSLLSNLIEFKDYIDRKKPHIICITETWLRLYQNINIKNYTTYRHDRIDGHRGGGVAILVDKNIVSSYNNTYKYYPNGIMEALVINLSLSGHNGNICLLYNPVKFVPVEEFDFYFSSLGHNSLILGDFNAHHSLWGDPTLRSLMNPTGKSLFTSYTSCHNFLLLTPTNLGTHYDIHTNRESTIDLVFGSGKFHIVDNVFKDPLMGSDHYPILYCFQFRPDTFTNISPYKWSFNKLDWKKWKEKIASSFENVTNPSLFSFLNIINDTTKSLIKLILTQKFPKYNKPFWDEECSKMRAIRRKLQRKYKQHKTPENKRELNKQTALTRKIMKNKKRSAWYNFCCTLDHNSSTTSVWNMFKSLENRPIFGFKYPILENNTIITDNKIISNLFSQYFANIFQNQSVINNYEAKLTSLQVAFSLEYKVSYNSSFTQFELQRCITDLNIKSSMGQDSFHNNFLYHLPQELYSTLLKAINKSWDEGIFPDIFKLSTLIPILKPYKDPQIIASYRPIALLSCLGKLMERLVYNRLYTYLENYNRIPIFQCGFRKFHSCLDVLLNLEHHIQIALKSKKLLLLVFFDIQKAFDSCNHTNILYNLLNVGIRGKMLKWLKDFFTNRKFNVRIGNTYSDEYSVDVGVPQGSILSPLLFSLMLSGLPKCRDIHTLLYADDLSMFVVEDNLEEANRKLQLAINTTTNWLNRQGFNLSAEKSVCMMFTRKKLTQPPILKMQGKNIRLTTQHKFLGLILDAPYLNWNAHIDNLVTVCVKKLNVLKALTSVKWGASRNTLLKLYNSFIKSKILYGLHIYSSASESRLKKLDIVQNQALRIITGLRRTTPITSMLIETKLPSIRDLINYTLSKTLLKIRTFPDTHMSHLLINNNMNILNRFNWNVLPHKAPFMIRAVQALKTINLNNLPNNCKVNKIVFPAQWLSLENFIILDFINKPKNCISTVEVQQKYLELRNFTYNNFILLFTDGSKILNGSVGAALFIENFSLRFSWRLNHMHSIFMSELFAIFKGLLWIKDSAFTNYVLFSDSMSALIAIRSHKIRSHCNLISQIKTLIQQIINQKKLFYIQYIPSHLGISSNDIVDGLAKEACTFDVYTNLNFEFEEFRTLLNNQFHKNMLKFWSENKTTLYIGEVIGDMKQWYFRTTGNRRLDVLMARFRSGCVGLQGYLYKIKQIQSPYCPHCPGQVETIKHYICLCPQYKYFRIEFANKLQSFGVKIDEFSLSDLFTGSGIPTSKYVKILFAFGEYVDNTCKVNL